jgi:hypothetical protein
MIVLEDIFDLLGVPDEEVLVKVSRKKVVTRS